MVQAFTDEEQLCWQKWTHARDMNAGNFLVQKYMPLVSYHVQRISVGLPKSVLKDDLRSLGMFGLFDALEKFDHSRDLKFDTYASFRIRGAIIDGLRKEDWLPRNTREKTKRVESAINMLEQRFGGVVSASDIALELNMTEEEIHSIMNEHFFANILSIDDQPLDQDEREGASFNLKDELADIPEDRLVKNELLDELSDMIETLSEKEQLVISLFYKEELTLTEIGQVMKLSTSRISQIHSKALFKLRQALEKVNF